MEKIIKEMEDFISDYESRARELPYRIENILRWYKWLNITKKDGDIEVFVENMQDPNLYEYIEVAGDAKRYLYENKASAEDIEKVRNGMNKYSSMIKEKVVEQELAEEGDALFNLVDKASDMSYNGTREEMIDSFVDKKIAGVGEYLSKLKRIYRRGDFSSYEYGNHEEYSDLVALMETVSSEDENRNKVFSSIQKWHEQPISHDNLDDYSYSFENNVNKTM